MDPPHMKELKNAAMAECTLFPRMPRKEVVVKIMNQRNNAFPISKSQKKKVPR